MSDLVERIRIARRSLQNDLEAWKSLVDLPTLETAQRNTVSVLDQAAAEIERLRARVSHWCAANRASLAGGDILKADRDRLRADLDRVTRERDEARQALYEYGQHDLTCPWWGKGPCTCRFGEILVEHGLEDQREAKP